MLRSITSSHSIGSLHVADLARLADVTPATVRHYSRIGLLSPQREPNGYRCFSAADTRRVGFIRRAQSLGLTISDIKTILESVDQGELPCHRVRTIVESRFHSVREQLKKLKETEARMSQALAAWENLDDETPADGELCPLIERIDMNEPMPSADTPHRLLPQRQNGHLRESKTGSAAA